MEVEVKELLFQRDMRRGIVNRELMMLYGYDVDGYLPPLPQQDRPKSSLARAWNCENQAVRQLSNLRRRGPRMVTFPGQRSPRQLPNMDISSSTDMERPHTAFDNHVKSVLNTRLSDIGQDRPATSNGKIESLPYHKLGPVENPEGLIVPKKLNRDLESVDAFSDLASVISSMGTGLRRPKISGLTTKKKKGRRGKSATLSLSSTAHTSEDIMRVIKCDMNNLPRDSPTKVKIYLCSSVRDMEVEKRYLTEHAYPELRQFCQQHGLDFQVVDILVDSDIDNVRQFQFKMEQMVKCQQESLGPNFVLLLGDRYGPSLVPHSLLEKDHAALCKMAEEHMLDNRPLLNECYVLDTNVDPPQMQLQTSQMNKVKHSQLEQLVREASRFAAQTSRVPQEVADEVKKSPIHHEVYQGVSKAFVSSPSTKCLCFFRHFLGLKEHLAEKDIPNFVDLYGMKNNGLKPMPDTMKQMQLDDLKAYATGHVGEENVKKYEVSWNGSGIQENCEEHKEYLQNLARDFVERVKRLIELNRPQWEVKNKHFQLYKEVVHHARIWESHRKDFVGRTEELNDIWTYLKDETKSHKPLILHGLTGQGKSALVSTVLSQAKEMLPKQTVTIIRYLGTSPQSSNLRELLINICEQICVNYNMDSIGPDDVESPKRMACAFSSYLDLVAKHHGEKKPLLMILDGIDQLDASDRSHTLYWLPTQIPNHVYLILTMESSSHEMLEKTEDRLKSPEAIMKLNNFDADHAKQLANHILESKGRQLTETQTECLANTISKCRKPLFVSNVAREASQWTSDQNPQYLPEDLDDGIVKLFYGLEDDFGEKFVRDAVYYLTLFKLGISEIELRDVLSTLENTHSDCMKSCTGGSGNLGRSYPQILNDKVSRVLARLNSLLSVSHVHGKTLIRWRHEQYRNLVKRSYFGTDEFEIRQEKAYGSMHELYFQQDGISKSLNGEESVNCQVMPQYLLPNNLRKLHMFPEFISQSGPVESTLVPMKTQTLCNFHWLLTKLEGTTAKALYSDFNLMQHDLEVDLIQQVIKIAYQGLRLGHQALASQMLGCLPFLDTFRYPIVNKAIQDAQNWLENTMDPILIPLLQCFPIATDLCQSRLWNLRELMSLDKTERLGVVKNKDGIVEIWDMENEEAIFHLGMKFDKVTPNIFCSKTKVLGINMPLSLKIWEIESGSVLQEVDLQEHFGSAISSLSCLCYTDDFGLLTLHMSDDEFNQTVAVVDTVKNETIVKMNMFDVKDEFFPDAAAMLDEGKTLVFVNARSEVVDKESMQNADFIKLSAYDAETGDRKFKVNCGMKKFNRLLMKDNDHALISWMDCSFDMYDLSHEGAHAWHYSAPEPSLQLQSCALTQDGYLVALAVTSPDSHQPHFGLWFWNLNDQVAAELLLQPIPFVEATPKHFLIMEELHMVALAMPGQAKISIWDLPTSTLVQNIQAHTKGLDSMLKTEDPYKIYTSSRTEKVVKLWNIYSVVAKDDTSSMVSTDIEDDTFVSTSAESMDGILKRPGSRQRSGKSKRPKSVRFADELSTETSSGLESELPSDSMLSDHSTNSTSSKDPSSSFSEGETKSDEGSMEITSEGTGSNNDLEFLCCHGSREKHVMQSQATAMFNITSVVVSSDSKFVVSGSDKHPPVIWNMEDGSVFKKLVAHNSSDLGTPWVALACKDEVIVGLTRTVVSGKEDWPPLFKYQTWTRATGQPLHRSPEESLAVTGQVSHDGTKAVLVTLEYFDPCGENKSDENGYKLVVKILNISTNQEIRSLKFLSLNIPCSLQLSEDNHYAVTLTPETSNSNVKVLTVLGLEVEKDKDPELCVYKYKRGMKHKKYGASSNCLLHNALSLAIGLNGDLQMWDITNCNYEGNLYQDPSEKDTNNPSLHNHGGKPMAHVTVSDDRRYLVCGGGDNVASVWDLDNEVMLFSYGGHSAPISQVAISHDNQLILTAGEDNILNVWLFSVVDKPLCQLYIHVAPTALHLSRDKQTVVAVGAQKNCPPRLLMFRLKNLRDIS